MISATSIVNRLPAEHGTGLDAEGRYNFQAFHLGPSLILPLVVAAPIPPGRDISLSSINQDRCSLRSGSPSSAIGVALQDFPEDVLLGWNMHC